MAYDAHKNLAYSTVATAPSPASSGTSLVVATGEGARFPAVPFNATIWPAGTIPTPANAEIVRVTTVSTDTLTITRAQESTSARSVIIGDQIAATITAKIITDVEANTREKLTADRTYYVRTDGNDSNTGLADTAGGAFLTIQKAVNVVHDTIDLAGFTATIQVRSGTYTGGISILGPFTGMGMLRIYGDTTTPSNVVISVTGSTAIYVAHNAVVSIGGFKVTTATSGACCNADYGANIYFDQKMEWGSSAWEHMDATNRALIVISADYTISGSAVRHWFAWASIINCSGRTITLSGTPAFSVQFANAHLHGFINCESNTYSGSATGTRYLADGAGLIWSNGPTLPGDAAGSTATSGVYV